jgi:hypothetical protein
MHHASTGPNMTSPRPPIPASLRLHARHHLLTIGSITPSGSPGENNCPIFRR